MHRTAGGLRVLSLVQARSLVPLRELVLPAAGNAGRWALIVRRMTMENTGRKRKPISKVDQVTVFRRDGWLCRWCKKPVIFAPVMKFIERQVRKSGYTDDLVVCWLSFATN